jgi:hypothetical protein
VNLKLLIVDWKFAIVGGFPISNQQFPIFNSRHQLLAVWHLISVSPIMLGW